LGTPPKEGKNKWTKVGKKYSQRNCKKQEKLYSAIFEKRVDVRFKEAKVNQLSFFAVNSIHRASVGAQTRIHN
jgi:hypothetical protein